VDGFSHAVSRIERHRARHRLSVSGCSARSWPEVVFSTTDPGVRPSRTPRPWGSRERCREPYAGGPAVVPGWVESSMPAR